MVLQTVTAQCRVSLLTWADDVARMSKALDHPIRIPRARQSGEKVTAPRMSGGGHFADDPAELRAAPAMSARIRVSGYMPAMRRMTVSALLRKPESRSSLRLAVLSSVSA